MWSDKETLYDCLGYSSYVNVLSDICIQQDLSPLTLGIFGAWGSGKTSLMSMLKYCLDQKTDHKILTLWFNAWKYEGRDEAQSALIHAILTKLTEGRTLGEKANATLKRLIKGASVLKLAKFITKTAITLTPDLTGFLECFEDQSKKVAETIEQFERDFEALLQEVDISHIVVFIDDLDRCPNNKVIETFETIKLFLNTPRCSFVVGADPQRIEQAVSEVYDVSDNRRSKDYLEKIVQLPFNIPVQNPQDIACYVGMLIVGRYISSNDGWNALISHRPTIYQACAKLNETLIEWVKSNGTHLGDNCAEIEKELGGILPYVAILGDGLKGNPRQIKRFLNILSLRKKLSEENGLEINDAHLIKMTVLEYVWEDFFIALAETVDPATGKSTLLEELLTTKDQTEEKSDIVEGFAEKKRLITFLKNDPQISIDIDLRPYLFLAQTSINRGKQTQLLPPDEKALTFAQTISGKDRVMSKAAALQAASEDADAAESVVKHLIAKLKQCTDNQSRTHIITGFDTICLKHKRLYAEVVKEIENIVPSGKGVAAVGVAGGNLLANAEKVGVSISSNAKEKFAKAAGPLSALTGTKQSTRQKR